MHFGLSRPQELLQRALRELLERECPIERVREIGALDDGARGQASSGLLAALADQGALGIVVPESLGGIGGTLLDAVVVAQELARAVAPVSFHEGWVLGALVLAANDGEARRALPGGLVEPPGASPDASPCASPGAGSVGGADAGPAERLLAGLVEGRALLGVVAEGLRLEAGVVLGEAVVSVGPGAELLAVVADGDARRLVLSRAEAPGLEWSPLESVDLSRPLWSVRGNARLEEVGAVLDRGLESAAVRRAVDAARIVLAADLYGAAQRALEIAVGYSLERRQFGRIVGSYQAIKHLCAERAAALEPVQSMLWQTAHAWDQRLPDAAWLAPLLKAHAADVAAETVTQATQVFGGMGFTWECDSHLFYKRVAQSRQLLGGPAELRAEAARLRYGAAGAAAG